MRERGYPITSGAGITVQDVQQRLFHCGYRRDLLRAGYAFGESGRVALAAFAAEPPDARSACIAVVETQADSTEAVAGCRLLGAPVVFLLRAGALEWWRQGARKPSCQEQVSARRLVRFFEKHKREFQPDAVFRAKTIGQLNRDCQLHFVDLGLMPLVEKQIGDRLSDLVERTTRAVASVLGPDGERIPDVHVRWVLQSIFRLVAAKILQDKGVGDFRNLDFGAPADVLARVAAHYGALNNFEPSKGKRQRALEVAAAQIGRFAHLGHVTTESLGHLYEKALVSEDTRKQLGTHCTPSYLADYIVWRMAPLIEQIPRDERDFFEPAFGHAAFMVSAMRLLRLLLPHDWDGRRRHAYFCKRLHGIEIDDFACETGRLSVTLADIPNPNGWDLQHGDMYRGDYLQRQASGSTIFLANPPFENFTTAERARLVRARSEPKHRNKTAEMLWRVLPHLPQDAVFGVVVPQGLLHGRDAKDLRQAINKDFDLQEICLFPDKVFRFSDAESAIIVGRKRRSARPCLVSFPYSRIRERDLPRFVESYEVSAIQRVPQTRFTKADGWNMRVPDLEDVWQCCRYLCRLDSIAQLGRAIEYKSEGELQGALVHSRRRFPRSVPGFAGWTRGIKAHELPPAEYLSVDPAHVRRPGAGFTTDVPQVLLNASPVSRGPWRLVALLDATGHAAKGSFLTVRPTMRQPGALEYVWVLCNSPLANAWMYAHAGKRHNLIHILRSMPVPAAADSEVMGLAMRAREYLSTLTAAEGPISAGPDLSAASHLLRRIDAELLRLYDLPPRLERRLLDLFMGWDREGVPFKSGEYFPKDFEPCVPLHEYLSEEYRRTTAGELRARYEPVKDPAFLSAMRRAVTDYGDDE
jgi:hypothetical protein